MKRAALTPEEETHRRDGVEERREDDELRVTATGVQQWLDANLDALDYPNEETGSTLRDDIATLARLALAAFRSPTPAGGGQEASIPVDLARLIVELGPVEWAQTYAHDADGHADHIRQSVQITAEHFGQDGPQHMHGLYLEGTETVLCHTGTSPNSPDIARALTGAWNRLLDDARAALSPNPSPAAPESAGADGLKPGWLARDVKDAAKRVAQWNAQTPAAPDGREEGRTPGQLAYEEWERRGLDSVCWRSGGVQWSETAKSFQRAWEAIAAATSSAQAERIKGLEEALEMSRRLVAAHIERAASLSAELDALKGAAQEVVRMRKSIETDVGSAHSGRGGGASEWMREDDRDFRRDLRLALDALANLTQEEGTSS